MNESVLKFYDDTGYEEAHTNSLKIINRPIALSIEDSIDCAKVSRQKSLLSIGSKSSNRIL